MSRSRARRSASAGERPRRWKTSLTSLGGMNEESRLVAGAASISVSTVPIGFVRNGAVVAHTFVARGRPRETSTNFMIEYRSVDARGGRHRVLVRDFASELDGYRSSAVGRGTRKRPTRARGCGTVDRGDRLVRVRAYQPSAPAQATAAGAGFHRGVDATEDPSCSCTARRMSSRAETHTSS